MRRFPWWIVFLGIGLAVAGGGYVAMTNRKIGPRWTRLLPQAREKAQELERLANAQGIPAMFFDGWRSPEVSAQNIAKGASRVADPLDSLHVWGLAFDMAFKNDLGMPEWPPDTDPRWKRLAELGASIGLNSGGLMWGWDWGHFQLPGFNVAALKQTYAGEYLAFLSSRGVV